MSKEFPPRISLGMVLFLAAISNNLWGQETPFQVGPRIDPPTEDEDKIIENMRDRRKRHKQKTPEKPKNEQKSFFSDEPTIGDKTGKKQHNKVGKSLATAESKPPIPLLWIGMWLFKPNEFKKHRYYHENTKITPGMGISADAYIKFKGPNKYSVLAGMHSFSIAGQGFIDDIPISFNTTFFGPHLAWVYYHRTQTSIINQTKAATYTQRQHRSHSPFVFGIKLDLGVSGLSIIQSFEDTYATQGKENLKRNVSAKYENPGIYANLLIFFQPMENVFAGPMGFFQAAYGRNYYALGLHISVSG